MISDWYAGNGEQRGALSATPALSRRARDPHPREYLPDEGLVNAVNVALLLNQPLLLTGEPGTGKSQLAYSVSWELGLGDPLRFNTKSTSTARELFYSYDAIERFQAAQNREPSEIRRFLTFNAMGRAIILANDPQRVEEVLGIEAPHQQPRRSVVLIDEVDKAPRDFPNDVLNEFERNEFQVTELRNASLAAPPEYAPILIITSNSERDLPDAFLRRCVFYNIPFPDKQRLADIVERRLGQYAGGSDAFLASALDVLDLLRRKGALRKPPSTAEFLAWLAAVRAADPQSPNPLDPPATAALATLSTMVKTAEDQTRALEMVNRWIAGRSSAQPAG